MKRIPVSQHQQIACFKDGPMHAVPLVFLHGFCEDSSVWNMLLPLLDDLQVIRIDLPGFGASDLAAHASTEDYADAVYLALQSLEVPKCVLIGHSLGGYIALEYLKRHAAHVAGIGLFHSHPYPDNAERIAIRQRGIEMLRQGKRDLYVSQLFPGLFSPHFSSEHPEVIQQMIAMGKQQSAEGIIAGLETMIGRPDHQQTLEQATCPVQFLLGAEDTLVPLDTGLKAALLPDVSDVQVLSDTGHMGMWEAPERSAELLKAFYQLAVEEHS